MSQLPFPEPNYELPNQLKSELQNLSEPDIDDTLQCQLKRRNGTLVLLIEKPPEVATPTASDTTRESGSLVARQNSNTTNPDSTIPKSGYGFFELIIKLFLRHSDELIEELEKSHKTRGRHGYPVRDQLCIFVLQCLTNERYNSYLLNRLSDSPKIMAICQINEVPSEYAYCRFKKKLVAYSEMLDDIYNLALRDLDGEIRRLKKAGVIPKKTPHLGQYLAIDATDIAAWAKYRSPHCNALDKENCTEKHKRHCNNSDRTKCSTHSSKPIADPSAMWGYRTPKGKSGRTTMADGEEAKEWFFGYKAHVIADAVYGIPLHIALRPANENETSHFAQDLDDTLERHPWLKPQFVLADKGYDSLPNFQHTVKQGIIPIIAVRRPQKDKETGQRRFDSTYDEDGRPVCVGGQSMEYLGTDQEGNHHFRCPSEGCWLKDKVDWSRYCNSRHSEQPKGKLLRIIGIVPRFTKLWRKIYNKRGAIERWFSSAKRSRLLDKHQLLEMGKIGLHANVSMLAWLLTALARLMADDYRRMRHMYIRLPRAGRETGGNPAELELAKVHDCQGCRLCPEHTAADDDAVPKHLLSQMTGAKTS